MEFTGASSWNRPLSTDITVPAIEPLRVSQPSSLDRSRSSIVVIDPTVKDYQQLVAGVQSQAEILILDPAQDAIAQITQTLLARSGVSSLHILSHGTSGSLQLGKTWLDLSSIDRYETAFKTWSQALTEDADILLYGCEIGAGESGQAFLDRLGQLTGADIAASEDVTGNSALGGDWNLEAVKGEIEAAIALDAATLNAYQGILPADLISVANPTLITSGNSVGIDAINRNAISGDGRYVVFTSSASTLAANDSNDQSDVFLYDRQDNTVTLISRTVSGNGSAAGRSFNPVISFDGNSVAFVSNANNLVSNMVNNSDNVDNIFVWNRTSNQITLVSRDANGLAGRLDSTAPSISDDGSFIAFQTQARLRPLTDPAGRAPDVYVWRRQSNDVLHVSSGRIGGSSPTQGASSPMISGDGNYVVFASLYSHLTGLAGDGTEVADREGQQDIFIWKRTTDEIVNLTVKGRAPSSNPVINRDGSRIAFVSDASELVAGDTNAARDIFVWRRSAPDSLFGTLELVSINRAGTASGDAPTNFAERGSQNPVISRDGNRIVFTSSSTDLVEGDTNGVTDVFVRDLESRTTTLVSRDSAGAIAAVSSGNAGISDDGNRVVFTTTASLAAGDTNNLVDVYVRDLASNQIFLVSRTPTSIAGNNASGDTATGLGNSVSAPIISSDGSFVVFSSLASNLVTDDTNTLADAFFTPVVTGNASLISRRSGAVTSRTGSGDSVTSPGASVSADGRFVVFTSAAAEIAENDANGLTDIFLRDRQAGTTTLISRTRAGRSGNGASSNPLISEDGRYIVFTSAASDLVDGDANGATDIFWYDRQTQEMRLVSRVNGGSGSANGASATPVMSRNGLFVAFTSTASNLIAGDTNNLQDVFIWDSQNGNVTVVSRGSAESNGASEEVVISADGQLVAFVSAASNLVAGDTNGKKDVFVWNRTTNQIALVSQGENGIGDGDSYQPTISRDGQVIAFTSTATNLVTGSDLDGDEDVFVRNLTSNTTVLVSAKTGGGYSNAVSAGAGTLGAFRPVMSGNGQFVSFTSSFGDLVGTDTNNTFDVFLRNLATNQTVLISANEAGTDSGNAVNGDDGGTLGGFITGSLNPVISDDGRFVAFISLSSNLVSNDTNNALDVFVRDTRANTTALVSLNQDDTASASGASYIPVINRNGTYIVFTSAASNLTAQDINGRSDVFGLNLVPTIGIEMVQGASSTAEGGTTPARYRVRRFNRSAGAISVKLSLDALSTASGTDYQIVADPQFNLVQNGSEITLQFADGVTEAILELRSLNDDQAEAAETVVLNVVATEDYAIADSLGVATGTITDTDTLVTNTNDAGEGSLRQAILNANANAGIDTIGFRLGAQGSYAISLTSALPEITDSVILDATTQPSFSGMVSVILDGTNAGSANGFVLEGDGSTIQGFEIRGFSQSGIVIDSNNNLIKGNTITANNGSGIIVESSAVNNRITENSIYLNTGLEIDLGRDGRTANDALDVDLGANNLQNTIVVTAADPSGTDSTVKATFNGTANSTFRVEFFTSSAADSSGTGEARRFLGFQTITTDANGAATIDFTASDVALGQYIAATVTDADGNTSEFSNALMVSQPRVSILALNPTQKENAGGTTTQYQFVVSLDRASSQDVTVRVNTTTDGTATGGTDFVAIDETLTFSNGETEKTIVVTVNGDRTLEPDETFSVEIAPLTNAVAGDVVKVTATIEDDDEPPKLSIVNVTSNSDEGNSGEKDFVFEVRLSEAATAPIRVNFATSDGTAISGQDYIAESRTIEFLAGETVKTITIKGLGDRTLEPNETFNIALSNVVGDATIDATAGTAIATLTNDDSAPTIAISGAPEVLEGESGTVDYVFTVTLDEASSETITVDYTTINGEATTADNDYVENFGTLTFAPGTKSQQIIVTVNGDRKFEQNETFSIQLSNPSNALLSAQPSAIATIRNDDTQPTISIQAAPTLAEGNSGTTTYGFTISLSNPSDQPITVDFATQNGTAIAGEDFAAQTGTLTFNAGETSKTIQVNVTGDTKREQDETFSIQLSNPGGATIGTATATIANDDDVPRVSVQNVTVVEGNSGDTPLQFEVTLSAASDQAIDVNYTLVDGTATIADQDYALPTGAGNTITFAPGETSKIITVNARGDAKREADETFTLRLDNVTNAAISTPTAIGTIQNDDSIPSLSVQSASIDEGGVLSFVVELSSPSNDAVSVNFATDNGTATLADLDYSSNSGTLTFAAGETRKTVTVQTTADNKLERDETINFILSNANNATIATSTAIGTIRNDDRRPTLGIQANQSGAEGGQLTFTVTLSNPSELPITVQYQTVNDTATVADQDYTATSGTLTFNPGDTSLTKTITVQTTADNKFEPDERFLVQLFNPDNADLSPSATEASGILTNDDSQPSISIRAVQSAKPEGNTGDTPFEFEVSLSNPSSETVTVNYATGSTGTATPGTDFTPVTQQTLTFAPGQQRQTITVVAKGDTVVENDEDFIVVLTGATGGTISGAAGQASGIISNDDSPPVPTIAIDDVVSSEGNNGTTTYRFKVRLSEATTNAVTINYATRNDSAIAGQDYQATSGTLTFSPGELEKEVVVTVQGDTIFENDERFFVTLSNPSSNAILSTLRSQATGAINNDDAKPRITLSTVTASEGDTGTKDYVFNVELSNPSSQTINIGYTTVDGTATVADQDYQTATGTLTFAPGETSKTITVKVNGDRKFELNEAFSIRLTPDANADLSTAAGQGVGTILPDDFRPTITISSPVATNEGNSGNTAIVFPVQLSNPSSETVTVNFTTRNGTATDSNSDYGNVSGTVTFAPGETQKTITVQAIGDTRYEPNENFIVELSNASGATIDSSTATATILNDDPLPQIRISANPITQAEGNSGLTPYTFEISLSEASHLPIEVTYSTADGTATLANNDYVSATQTITFAPGELRKTITVNALGDTQLESNETFQVRLSNPINATIVSETATVTIENDEAAPPPGTVDNEPFDIFWRNSRTGEHLLWQPQSTVFDRSVSFFPIPDSRWEIVATGDMDGDGDGDLVWRNSRTGENSMWEMQDNQVIRSYWLMTVGDLSWEVQGVGDFNKDRKLDIVWRNNRTGENSIWFLNDFQFISSSFIKTVPTTSWTIAGIGDFNNDLGSDILWRNQSTGDVAMWLMNGIQTISENIIMPGVNLAWQIEGIGDFSGDRFFDILWRNNRTGENSIWRLNNGNFQISVPLPNFVANWVIEGVGDFDEDRNLDILWRNVSNGDTALWYLNRDSFGTITRIRPVLEPSWQIEGIGRFAGDASPSIMWRNQSSGLNTIWLLKDNPLSQELPVEAQPNRDWEILDTGDFDNDGNADLLWRNQRSGENSIWLMNNHQVRQKIAPSSFVVDLNWTIQGTGDFNLDGNRDILWRNRTTGRLDFWLLNQGRLSESVMLSPTSALDWSIEGIVDLNGDRSLDLLWRSNRGEVGYWFLNRTTATQSGSIITVGDLNWQIEGLADFNGDRNPDLLWHNRATGEAVVWMMNGVRWVRESKLGVASLGWFISGVGDFNIDGSMDLLWRQPSAGNNAVWYLNQGEFSLSVFLEPLVDPDWQVEGITDF